MLPDNATATPLPFDRDNCAIKYVGGGIKTSIPILFNERELSADNRGM